MTSDSLAGRTDRSPYFLLSYLAAKRAGAQDWWHAVDIGTDSQGIFKLEYHHIHPRATLRDTYSKTEINDLANFAFISSKANKKILDRSPAKYFPEIGEEQLQAHFVPLAEQLRTPENYPEFIGARRGLLADAMTELLDAFAPSSLTGDEIASDPATGERLSLAAFGDSVEDPAAVLTFHATVNGTSWEAAIPLRDARLFLSDLENGYSAALTVGDESIELEAGAEAIELPLGPLTARGTLEEWRAVLEREIAELTPASERPDIPSSGWKGERVAFPISDSE